MEKYSIIILSNLIDKFESSVKHPAHRGFSYMAKGALITYIKGFDKALYDLMKIFKWAKEKGYLSHSDWNLAIMIKSQIETNIMMENTDKEIINGREAPWQEWPTMIIKKPN